MVHDLIYANSSPQALDLRCSNSLHIGPLDSQALAMNFGFFCAVDIPKPAATPQRSGELDANACREAQGWLGYLYIVLPWNRQPDSKGSHCHDCLIYSSCTASKQRRMVGEAIAKSSMQTLADTATVAVTHLNRSCNLL